jgi:hypothetical protein
MRVTPIYRTVFSQRKPSQTWKVSDSQPLENTDSNLNFDLETVKPTCGRWKEFSSTILNATVNGLQTKKLPSFLSKREVIIFLLFKRSGRLNVLLFKSTFVRNC